jgi:acyl-CoA thioester hydrolase
MIFDKTFVFPVRVEFEDVDMFGVLHHPKYLAYLERGRSEMLEHYGLSVADLARVYHGIVIADLQAKYFKPGRVGERVFVVSRLGAMKAASMRFVQVVVNKAHDKKDLEKFDTDQLDQIPGVLFWAELRFASVDLKEHRPMRIPDRVKKSFGLPEDEKKIPPKYLDIRLRASRGRDR